MGKLVLLVESDRKQAGIYKDFLIAKGYDVKVAYSADAAIEAADSRAPDAVILEIQLPEHNGIEFLYELRSYSDWHAIPVIVYSMIPPERFKIPPDDWADYGVRDYLCKPRSTLQDLDQALLRVCRP